ncbi:MAG: FHA domain-containing protein [Myxococcales bacterium]|nr:FHA domain-containing protein [Myxococcales bacterium]
MNCPRCGSELFRTGLGQCPECLEDLTGPPAPPGATARLTCVGCPKGGEFGRAYPITESRAVVGRGNRAAIKIDDPRISREHLVLEQSGGTWFVKELSPSNPTRLDHHWMHPGERRELHGSEVLRIGETYLRFEAA